MQSKLILVGDLRNMMKQKLVQTGEVVSVSADQSNI